MTPQATAFVILISIGLYVESAKAEDDFSRLNGTVLRVSGCQNCRNTISFSGGQMKWSGGSAAPLSYRVGANTIYSLQQSVTFDGRIVRIMGAGVSITLSFSGRTCQFSGGSCTIISTNSKNTASQPNCYIARPYSGPNVPSYATGVEIVNVSCADPVRVRVCIDTTRGKPHCGIVTPTRARAVQFHSAKGTGTYTHQLVQSR